MNWNISSDNLQRDIFLTCRPVFAGPGSQLRRPKKMRELLQQHKLGLIPLFNKYGIEKFADGARRLLELKVFESSIQAKIQFPELYETTALRGAQRAASECEAARSEAEALAEIEPIQVEADNLTLRFENPIAGLFQVSSLLRLSLICLVSVALSISPDGQTPTLFPAYLTYKSQHRALTMAQGLLEQACFELGQRWLPQAQQAKKWDCAEAVEITKWTRMLAKYRAELPADGFCAGHGPLSESLIYSTDRLRHAAVHRLPTTAEGVQQMVLSAAKFATALNDTVRAARLHQMHRELENSRRDMEGNKEFLESRLDQEVKTMEQLRADLDKRETTAVAAMIADDRKY